MAGFPCGSAGKESASDAGDLGLLSGLGKSPGEGKVYPLRYSGLENSTDYIVHGLAKEVETTKSLSLSLSFFIYSNYSVLYSLILSSASVILLLISPRSVFNLSYCILHY